MNVGSGNDIYLVVFSSNKRSGLVDTGHRSLEGNTARGREQEASRDVVPTIHGTFSGCLTVGLQETLGRNSAK
jgi:hypothetical protein